MRGSIHRRRAAVVGGALGALVMTALFAAGCSSDGNPPDAAAPSSIDLPAADTITSTIPPVTVDPATTTTNTSDGSVPTGSAPITTLGLDDQPTVTRHGVGFPLWWSRDNTAIIVAAVNPFDTRIGCEGFPRSTLFRQPLATETRSLALDADDALDLFARFAQPGNEAVFVGGCEGSVSELWIGQEATDGTVTDLAARALTPSIHGLTGRSLSIDGSAIIGSAFDQSADGPVVVSADIASGVVSELFAGGYRRIDQLPDGGFVAATADEVRHLDPGGALIDVRLASTYVLSADRKTIGLFTRTGLELGPVDGPPDAIIALPDGDPDELGPWNAVMVPDGTGVIFTRWSSVPQPLWLATTDGLTELGPAEQWGWLAISDDGSRLAGSLPLSDEGDPFVEEVVVLDLAAAR